MKDFKTIRSKVNEEYYTGPTSYVGGDRTNIGDIAGADLGGLANGGDRKPYATLNDMKVLEQALNQELFGVHQDPVTALAKAGTKFSSTGLVFDLKTPEIKTAMVSGSPYEVALTFAGHPLGEAPDENPADDFAAREIGDSGLMPAENMMPETSVRFTFEPVGTGYKINVDFV